MQIMNNKKGVKFLAAIAVFAMVVAALVVALPASDVDAVESDAGKYDPSKNGPLNFDAGSALTIMKYGEKSLAFDNYTLGNQIEVTYDADSKTYVVTGILAKQDLTKETGFKAVWTANTEYAYGLAFAVDITGETEVQVGDGKPAKLTQDDGCLLYIKETKVSTVKIGDKEYTIDFTGVTLSDDVKNNPTKAYVTIPNSNALIRETSGVDGNGGKWELVGKTLTLTNYNGKEYFNGAFETVILVGDSTITLSGATSAIASTSGITIKSIDGVGSLSIVMETTDNASAIQSNGALEINGIDVTIEMTEKYTEEQMQNKVYFTTKAVDSKGFSIYDGSLTIDAAVDNYYDAYGIFSAGIVDLKSSDVTINAGSRGIEANGMFDITIAASDVSIKADQLGIRTGTTDKAKLSITNKSTVDVEIYGLAQGYDFKPYGISVSGNIEIQSDSIVNTDGLIIYGNKSAPASVNNATLVNNGEMLIWKGATFENKAVFQNSGIVGVYGLFVNSAGETTNNGEINTYGIYRNGVAVQSGKTITTILSETDNGKTTTKNLVIDVKRIMPQANGTYLIDVEVSCTTAVSEDIVSPQSEVKPTSYLGTIAYTSNDGYVINAISTSGTEILTASKTADNYNIYSTEFGISYIGKAEKDKVTYVEDSISGMISNNDEGTISVSGGKFNNAGKVSINNPSLAFVAGGEFANAGDLTINADIGTTSGKLNGNGATIATGIAITLKGTVDMEFTVSGTYTPAQTGTTTPTAVQFTDVVKVIGKPNGTTISTKESTTAGFIAISGMTNADSKGEVTVSLVQGSATVDGTIGSKMVLAAETGTTLQIVRSGATATAGVIAIQDGATINMRVSTDRNTLAYGELKYTISFQNDGYTYYGSLQFALANAAEGATMDLSDDAVIDANTVVKKGIILNFAEGKKLTITGTEESPVAVSMEADAQFVLGKNSQVIIDPTYVTFSGTIVYDVNEIVMNKVVFEARATVGATTATTSTPSAITVTIDAVDGEIDVVKGTVKGTITVEKTLDSNKLKTTAKLTVAEGAVADLTAFVDTKYAETAVNGTLKLSAPVTTINGKLTGAGSVVIKDATAITFKNTASASIAIGNGTDAFVLDKVTAASYDDEGKYVAGTETFTVSAIAKTGTKAAYITISGDVISGTITSQGNTAFGAADKIFTLGTKAVAIVPKDAILTIVKIENDGKMNTADGLLKIAGTINMKIADDSTTNTYGTLNYQITYTDGDYTVYTMLATGVGNASAGDSFTISQNLDIEKKMEIPAGVSIIIAEDAAITVKNGQYITIGTPITTLGASTSSISGKVILEDKAFLIAYNDGNVDLSKAKIVVIDHQEEYNAKNSQYNMLNEIYATVYVAEVSENQQDAVEKVLVPTIDGYRFLGWNALVKDKSIGETDFDANMKANMVQITFQKADGISYYVDNEKMNIIGAPVYVAYGATITAVADSGYTGTPLVNGKTYLTVDNTFKTVVGSGVSPAEPVTPVTPAEPEKDDGMGLTDILLIVLVILAAILVIVVAIRMMRS